jgi:hypothetical protein
VGGDYRGAFRFIGRAGPAKKLTEERYNG